MGNVQQIKTFIGYFAPEGQKMALDIMRANKKMLSSPKGIASLFEKLLKTGDVAKLEQYLPCRLDEPLIDTIRSSFLGKSLSQKQILFAIEKMGKNESKMYIKNTVDMVADDIVSKKGELVELVKSLLPKHKITDDLAKAKTKKEIIKILQEFGSESDAKITDTFKNIVIESGIKLKYSKNNYQVLPLEALQETYKMKESFGEIFLKIQKLINPKSTNPEIIRIENILKRKYGFEYAHFCNLEEAKKFLQAVKIQVKEGTPLPKAVSTSSLYSQLGGGNIQMREGNLVLINPLENLLRLGREEYALVKNSAVREFIESTDKIYNLRQQSTNNPLHVCIHEIEHSNGIGYGKLPFFKNLIKYKGRNGRYKRIYDKDNVTTADKLCGYAEKYINGLTEEVRTELRTKKILEPQNFTADEQKLLDYFS